jgi:hypothetical protein
MAEHDSGTLRARSRFFTWPHGSCFDAELMFCGWSRHIGAWSWCGTVLAVSSLGLGFVHAEGSVASLLQPAPAAHAPTAELAEQLAELARRPFAGDSAVQRALARTRDELAALDAAYARGADAAVVRRRTALVWAALSWVDRLEARAHTSAALAGLEARAQRTEAAAMRARAELERERAGSAEGEAAEAGPVSEEAQVKP